MHFVTLWTYANFLQLNKYSLKFFLKKYWIALKCVSFRCTAKWFSYKYISIVFQIIFPYQFSSVQSLSRVWLFVTPWIAACQAFLSITISQSSLTLMSIELVMPFNHLILCHPFLLLPSILQHQSLFKWVGSSHQVAKVSEFQLQHHSFQWIFRTDFL